MVMREYVVRFEEEVGNINALRRFHHRLKHSEDRSHRFPFAPWQLARLEAMFAQCHYQDVYVRECLASEVQLSESQIRKWFIERRMKWRREALGIQPSSPARIVG
jgi:hypothetical protein